MAVLIGVVLVAASAVLGLGLYVTRERTSDPWDAPHREDVEVTPWP